MFIDLTFSVLSGQIFIRFLRIFEDHGRYLNLSQIGQKILGLFLYGFELGLQYISPEYIIIICIFIRCKSQRGFDIVETEKDEITSKFIHKLYMESLLCSTVNTRFSEDYESRGKIH